MADTSQHSYVLLAFFTLVAAIVIVSVMDSSLLVKVLKSYRDRLKLLNTGFQARYRDVF